MADGAQTSEPEYHLWLDADEVRLAAIALRLLDSDEAHEPHIHRLIGEILSSLERSPDDRGVLTVALVAEQMKLTHSAVKLLLDDLQREQATERDILRRVLEKLPDEHTMRAIVIE